MKHSDTIGELAKALAAAQGEMRGATKDSANPFFKSKYADLASVWDACREPLSKHGLSVVQFPRAEGPKVTVETVLAHASGEWMSDDLTVTAKEETPQSVGSAITYARRYALQSAVGIAPEDDDGEAAQGRHDTGAGRTARHDNGEAAAKVREAQKRQVADPKARTQAVISQFAKRWQGEARARLGHVIGRTIPANIPATEITLSDEELAKAEAAAALGQAHDNAARA